MYCIHCRRLWDGGEAAEWAVYVPEKCGQGGGWTVHTIFFKQGKQYKLM